MVDATTVKRFVRFSKILGSQGYILTKEEARGGWSVKTRIIHVGQDTE